MSKRGGRVPPPPRGGEWDLRFGDKSVADGWEHLCQHAPGPTREAWETLSRNPRDRSARQHPLMGSLAERTMGGRSLEQWQYEVTGAGRIWYCIDDAQRRVLITAATTGHPKQTEKRR